MGGRGGCRWLRLAALAWLVAGATEAQESPFLSRDFRTLWQNEVFENYAPHSYRDYDFEQENRRFDFFGDQIIDGVDVLEFSETRRDRPGLRGSYESRNGRYERFFDKLIIANEGFGPWSTRLIIGDHITTHFTPMTLNLPSFSGLRWDGASSSNRFSVITANLTDPVLVPSSVQIDQDIEERRIFGTSILAGHWESQIGSLLKLGTTYVNTHRFDSEAGIDVNSLRGTVPRVMHGGLKQLFVFFSDDDPEDGNPGAGVHELTAYADGRRLEPVRVGRIDDLLEQLPVTPDLTSTILLDANDISYLRRNRAWLEPVIEASNTPFFIALIDDITRVVTPARVGAPLRADGDDVVFYQFEVPDTTRAIDFDAVVADDYSIDVVGAVNVPVLAAGADDYYYDWYNAARAAGTPGGSSNLQRLRFEYGFPTGISLMGANMEARFLGVHMRGEYARSTRYFRTLHAQGGRFERTADTWWLQAEREIGDRWAVGFELFDVPDDYETDFDIFRRSSVGPTLSGRLYTPVQMVADNDDLDQWEDELEHNDPLAPYVSSFSSAGNGVFPGLDPDSDGILDFDVDNDGQTDAFQPFLGYRSESPDLVYGDDYNNNGVADYRENDNLPDYLYPADHRGYHGFVSVTPTERTVVRLGRYRVRQEALGRRNFTDYVEGRYQREWEATGFVRVNQRFKKLRDDVQNTIYSPQVTSDPFPRTYQLRKDRLENRDALSSLTYVEWGLWSIPGVQLRNIASYEVIDVGGGIPVDPLFSRPGTVSHVHVVSKADYTWTRGRLLVSPQFKHIYQVDKYPERDIPDRQRRWVMPILRADWQLGPRTVLKMGVQGFPGLPETSTDPANPEQDFRRTTYTAFVENRSNYQGYDMAILMGLYRSKQTFTGSTRPAFGSLQYFFRVYIG
jgi:hypothetical protein